MMTTHESYTKIHAPNANGDATLCGRNIRFNIGVRVTKTGRVTCRKCNARREKENT